MRTWIASLSLVAFCSCTGALAQDAAAPASTADPAKVEVAAKILEETHSLDNMRVALDTMIPPLVNLIKQQAPGLSDDQLKMVSDMLLDEMKSSLPKMLIANARIYATHFTLDELKAIDGFYQTPAGQKIIAENPKIVKEVIPLGMAWGRETAAEALPRVMEKLRKLGVKI